jgi:PTH1 family peptidyl-tRNA hydrolase
MWLVVGLGNPGPEYADNRHNIGFLVVDELCRRWGQSPGAMRGKFGSEMLQVDLPRPGGGEPERVWVQKPMEYMNLSGQAVQRATAFYRIDVKQVVVIHDDIDLPMGRVKVKVGGGHGGHNGLRSISGAVGPAYLRVRCGVGRPQGGGGKERVTGHVLGGFSRAEQREVPLLVTQAADAVEDIIWRGPTFAMNQHNRDPEREPEAAG